MVKKQEQAITRQEFNSLSSGHKALSDKVDHIDEQLKHQRRGMRSNNKG